MWVKKASWVQKIRINISEIYIIIEGKIVHWQLDHWPFLCDSSIMLTNKNVCLLRGSWIFLGWVYELHCFNIWFTGLPLSRNLLLREASCFRPEWNCSSSTITMTWKWSGLVSGCQWPVLQTEASPWMWLKAFYRSTRWLLSSDRCCHKFTACFLFQDEINSWFSNQLEDVSGEFASFPSCRVEIYNGKQVAAS